LSSALVIGCGYVGEPLLKMFSSQAWKAVGVTLSEESASKLRREGLNVLAADIRRPDFREALIERAFSLVIHCASAGGSNNYRALFEQGTRNLFAALEVEHFLFVSSTSVYAQIDGAWVDEGSAAEPERATGKVLRVAEDWVLERGGTVARLSGIYGPGRSVPLRRLLSGDAVIEGAGERVMNGIYRDDAVSALSLLGSLKPGGIFNVVDDDPVSQLEWFRWVSQRVEKPMPPFGPRDLTRKRAWTNKKVCNAKLRGIGWRPRFPSFREGIAEILAMGGA
jgi:nucleoside-diphosphate-sugar epimerase